MHERSLFATLLRSPWWMSFAAAGIVSALAITLLPQQHKAMGTVTGFPMLVIGCIAAWRQLRAPSARHVEAALAAVRAMTWPEFSQALQAAYQRQGYSVKALSGPAAQLEISRGDRVTLVHCKRWKAAHTGVDPLQALHAAAAARNADECIYMSIGDITDGARAYARAHGIRLIDAGELAALLPVTGRVPRAA